VRALMLRAGEVAEPLLVALAFVLMGLAASMLM
jgi:hypothetical protein